MAASAPYDALTLDTNIIIRDGFNFESGLLAQLKQFKGGPAEFILSQVVFQEVYKHLVKATRAAAEAWDTAALKAIRFGVVSPAASLPVPIDFTKAAAARVTAFGTNSGARLVLPDVIAVKDVMDCYFHNRPPFEAAGKKKEEFPDAIALLSIEAWARGASKKVLAVSNDAGWKAFADGSEFIDVVPDLGEALGIFQRHAAGAVQKIRDFIRLAESGGAPDALELIEDHASDEIHGILFDCDYESEFEVDVDDIDIDYRGLSFTETGGEYDITVVRLGRNEIAARVGVKIDLEATAWFSFFASEGKSFVGGGSSTLRDTLETYLLLTFSGEAEHGPDKLALEQVEFVEDYAVLDFGTISLDSTIPRDSKIDDLPQLPFDDLPEQQISPEVTREESR